MTEWTASLIIPVETLPLGRNKSRREMKVVTLCSCCDKCPVVKVAEDHVEIGEAGNLCTLKKEDWEVLKQKVLSGEL